VVAGLAALAWLVLVDSEPSRVTLRVTSRDVANGVPVTTDASLDPKRIGIVVIDPWNAHWDPVAQTRVDALVPLLNLALEDARAWGMTVFVAAADIPLASIVVEPGPARARPEVSVAMAPPAYPGNGFWWPERPEIPYFNAHPDQSQVPPDVERERLPRWTNVHPGLRVTSTDIVVDFERWQPDDSQEAWDLPSTRHVIVEARERGLTHLVFVGVHTNWSVLTKNVGMTNLERAGFTVLVARDLVDAFTGNGTDWEADPPREDPSVTPDWGNRLSVEFIEGWFASVDSADWARSDSTRYAATVLAEDGLLAYWRMESAQPDVGTYLDQMRLESAWQEPVANPVCDGAIGRSVCLTGAAGLVIGPALREELPPASPLRSIASSDATIEVWVRPDTEAATGWVVAHDDGESLDFALGLVEGQLVLEALNGAVQVRGAERLAGGEWRHVAAVLDHGGQTVRLYLDGDEDASAPLRTPPAPVEVASAWVVGGRGPVVVANGDAGEDRSGRLLQAGTGGLVGAVDELAVYAGVLHEDRLREHSKRGAR